MKFDPPVEERTDEQLIAIAHSPDEWQEEVILLAKAELKKRNISEREQEKVIAEWTNLIVEQEKSEESRLEKNETESFTTFEMLILLFLGPLVLFSGSLFNSFSLSYLKRERYKLKLKQFIIIVILSFVGWILYINYTSNQSHEKRVKEIENMEESDWEKNRIRK